MKQTLLASTLAAVLSLSVITPTRANDMEAACRVVMKHLYAPQSPPKILEVTSFPEASKPRVVFSHVGREDIASVLSNQPPPKTESRCFFDSAQKPMNLVDMNLKGRSTLYFQTKFEEAQIILKRAGF
ncbi:MAG: hypothetical protein AAF035_11315 [Pseudomonadota bacterium]